jgi:hypothetical protein
MAPGKGRSQCHTANAKKALWLCSLLCAGRSSPLQEDKQSEEQGTTGIGAVTVKGKHEVTGGCRCQPAESLNSISRNVSDKMILIDNDSFMQPNFQCKTGMKR